MYNTENANKFYRFVVKAEYVFTKCFLSKKASHPDMFWL